MTPYVIVTLGGECPESDTPSRCVMDVIGPFNTRSDAGRFAEANLPAWAIPHFMRLQSPEQYLP